MPQFSRLSIMCVLKDNNKVICNLSALQSSQNLARFAYKIEQYNSSLQCINASIFCSAATFKAAIHIQRKICRGVMHLCAVLHNSPWGWRCIHASFERRIFISGEKTKTRAHTQIPSRILFFTHAAEIVGASVLWNSDLVPVISACQVEPCIFSAAMCKKCACKMRRECRCASLFLMPKHWSSRRNTKETTQSGDKSSVLFQQRHGCIKCI